MDKQILNIERSENTTVIRLLHSRIYQDIVPEFREQILSLLDKGHNRIVFDLSKVEVMNSSGLGILILMQDRLDQIDGRMVLTGLSSIMEHLFSQMKLGTLFQVAKSEDEAMDIVRAL